MQQGFRRHGMWSQEFMAKYLAQGTSQVLMSSHLSGAWPAANRALYLPFELEQPMIVERFWLLNGATASGNVDMAIYAADGVRLTPSVNTAQSGTNTNQELDVTDTLIGRGAFWLGIALSSGTGTVFRVLAGAANDWLAWGAMQEASASPLPATATFAANTTAYLPTCGFTGRLF